MPDGRVLRIDTEEECVYIVRRGRTYRAPLSEVESAARVPSARVHFGLRRSDGIESAEAVRLRRGTRTNRRHRRFGDLTGATRPGAKIQTKAQREFGIDVTTQPLRVVEAWITAMEDQNFDGASALYLPEAVVHTLDGAAEGRKRVRSVLQDSGWRGGSEDVVLHGEDRFVVIEPRSGTDVQHTSFVVHDGSISEQWFGVEPETEEMPQEADVEIELVDRSGLPERTLTYAEDRFDSFISNIPETVMAARMKLTMSSNTKVVLPALVEATLELDKKGLVRVRSAATTVAEAVDQVLAKFGSKLEHSRDRHRHSPVGVTAEPGTWRKGNRPSSHLPYFERDPEDREIVRHKTVAAGQMTLEEAAWDADLMEFDFFLFEEISTGHDCLIERTEDSYRVRGLGLGLEELDSAVGSFEFVENSIPKEPLGEAIEMLDQTGERFHFFTNERTERANVLYRRVDGHYGLITFT